MTKIQKAVILITGADGGIGSALLKECARRKAKKIYASGLNLDKLHLLANEYPEIVFPLLLDVTDDKAIQKASGECGDVNILINNAGIELKSSFIGENAVQRAMLEMRINYVAIISLVNAFLPGLRCHAPSHIINVLSVGSVAIVNRLGTYCASKAAAHTLTHSMRDELKSSGIQVTGVYPGYVDTAMSTDVTVEKATPESIAIRICEGIIAGDEDIYPDKMSSDFFKKNPMTITYLT